MARFLFATQPISGHVLPFLLLARALTERGHDVRWYGGAKFRARIEAAGARFLPYQAAYDYDDADLDAAFPGRTGLSDFGKIKYDFIHAFMNQIAPQYRDLQAILQTFSADALVVDTAVYAAQAISDKGGPPFATPNISVMAFPGRDLAPFGLGLLPSYSRLGRVRNRVLGFLAAQVIFRPVHRAAQQQAAQIGWRLSGLGGPLLSPFLYLQPTVPSFEYRRTDLPPQVHFIGPLLPPAPPAWTPPAWWGDVRAARRPVVLVTQGTIATDASELIAPTVRALAREDALVLVTGDAGAVTAAAGGTLPANVRVAPFIPFAVAMPYVRAYVTNGGYGGVQYALAHGVPLVVAGATEDKPEVANRVAYFGYGVNLKTARPAAAQVRQAVRQVLDDPAYRRRVQRVQMEMARYDAPTRAADLLEALAHTRQPVPALPKPGVLAAA